jgi:hypothetical protein
VCTAIVPRAPVGTVTTHWKVCPKPTTFSPPPPSALQPPFGRPGIHPRCNGECPASLLTATRTATGTTAGARALTQSASRSGQWTSAGSLRSLRSRYGTLIVGIVQHKGGVCGWGGGVCGWGTCRPQAADQTQPLVIMCLAQGLVPMGSHAR